MKLPPPAPAFSLVEVTLALGVAAFCLVAVFGLLPVGLNSNKASIEQTRANGILSAVVADLRATPPTSPPGSATTSGQFGIPIPANPVGSSSAGTTFFFTSDGEASATMVPESRYRLTVTFLKNESAKSATLASVRASWPASIDPATQRPAGLVRTFVAMDRN